MINVLNVSFIEQLVEPLKALQNFMTNIVFWKKSKTQQQQQQQQQQQNNNNNNVAKN